MELSGKKESICETQRKPQRKSARKKPGVQDTGKYFSQSPADCCAEFRRSILVPAMLFPILRERLVKRNAKALLFSTAKSEKALLMLSGCQVPRFQEMVHRHPGEGRYPEICRYDGAQRERHLHGTCHSEGAKRPKNLMGITSFHALSRWSTIIPTKNRYP